MMHITKDYEILPFLQVIDDLRYKAIFSITYSSGLRLSEVQKLHIQDVASKQMRLFIYQAKGQKDLNLKRVLHMSTRFLPPNFR